MVFARLQDSDVGKPVVPQCCKVEVARYAREKVTCGMPLFSFYYHSLST